MLRLAGAALAVALAGLAAAPAARQSPAPTAWTVTPVAFCRYDVNISGLADPHGQLGKLRRRSAVVCPFAGNGTSSVRLFLATADASTCSPADLPGLLVSNAVQLPHHEYDRQAGRCYYKDQLLGDERAPGKVFLITAHPPARLLDLSGKVSGLLRYEGLPVRWFEAAGFSGIKGKEDTEYLCFEMTADADIDPLAYLRSASIEVPASAHEELSDSPNCFAASGKLQNPDYVPPPRSALVGNDVHAFSFGLRESSISLAGRAFKDAVVDSLAANGLPHIVRGDGRFDPLSVGDGRSFAIDYVDRPKASFETTRLTPALCSAMFAAMQKTSAFIPPPDDESPTIVLSGVGGGPPPQYQVLSLVTVGSPTELCAALQPAFDRWAAAQRTEGQTVP